MTTEIPRTQTPEQLELERKLCELSELEAELAQFELDFATLQVELHVFETRYFRIVGVRLAELDEIEAQIAEAEPLLKPKDPSLRKKAAKARTQAKESAEATGITQDPIKRTFQPSEGLKALYREVAKRIHPDLAEDEGECLRRQKLMAEANRAYEEGDEAKLRAILDEWKNSPESVKGEGTATELVRAIRKIAQISKRLATIELEIAQLKGSNLYNLNSNDILSTSRVS